MHTTATQMKWRTTKAVRRGENEILGKCEVNPEFSTASSPWDICQIPAGKKKNRAATHKNEVQGY